MPRANALVISGVKGGYNIGAKIFNSEVPVIVAYSIVYLGPPAAMIFPPLALPVGYSFGPALTFIRIKESYLIEFPEWK